MAKNCLTTIGQYTPIQVTLCYQPALLPDAGRGEAQCDDSVDDGVSRFGHRLREIAVQSMVATTAADRA
eukprot:5364431-Prorocentrum_lima.AAC.1